MQREKILLPPLHEPLVSSRITSFQEYAQWDRQRKEAYRNELKEEIRQHDRSRQNLERQKEKDLAEVNALVREERHRHEEDRHFKIKTEQKYMHDNWSMLQQSQRTSPYQRHPSPNPEASFEEHPFVRLVDKQDERKQQTKKNFIFQNKLNDLQSEMKRVQADRRKEFQSQQRKEYDEHIEDEYRKKRREREQFQSKYLKIDKNSNYDCKKEYLEYLKAQAALTRSHSKRHPKQSQTDPINQVNRASPGNIGLSPASFDRIKQLQTIQKSLKLFKTPNQSRNHSTLDYRGLGNQTQRPNVRVPAYQKVVTERAAPITQNLHSEPFETIQTKPSQKIYPIQSQLSQRLDRPTKTPKPYRQYNIINGTDRIFFQ